MRSNSLDAARRAYLGAVRGIFNKADDSKKMQVVDARHLHNEQNPTIERFQNFGHSSVPLPPDQSGGKAAETLTIFNNGNRAHPIIIAVDDRRHRPMNLKPGESTLYDDQGQQVYLTRAGIVIAGGSSKLPVNVKVGNLTVTYADGKATIAVNETKVIVKDGSILLGSEDASDAVMLVSGPSSKIFGVA